MNRHSETIQDKMDSPSSGLKEDTELVLEPAVFAMAEAESEPKSEVKPPYTAFSPARRRYILSIVTIAGLFGPLAGNIYLPALPVLENAFDVSGPAINVSVTVFMAVFAIGPLMWSTLADWKGRRPLYILSIAIYIIANVLMAAVPSDYGALLVLRILQAFGSSAVVSMGAGTVADVTEVRHRAASMSIFLLGPQLGPVIGPVLGGLFAGETSWRWIFGFLAISGFCLWMIIVTTLPETLRARVGDGSVYSEKGFFLLPLTLSSPLIDESKRGPPPPKPSLANYWSLCRYPPIGIVSFNTAILYSTYFCIALELPTNLENTYNWSTTVVGLAYLAIGMAMMVGSICGGQISDWRRRKTVTALGRQVDPEYRLVDQIWGVLLCAAGCLMYGWFIRFSIHPAAVIAATFLTGFGMTWVFVTTTAFLSECVPTQAAGAFALGNLLRNPAAAIAAVVIQPLVSRMGIGWCFTGLALMNLACVGSAVILLRAKCPTWRRQKAERVTATK